MLASKNSLLMCTNARELIDHRCWHAFEVHGSICVRATQKHPCLFPARKTFIHHFKCLCTQHQSATANAGATLLSDLIAQAEHEMNEEELMAANQGHHDSDAGVFFTLLSALKMACVPLHQRNE
eukprot:1147386-Pelagomonas_calceolata.AAC.9